MSEAVPHWPSLLTRLLASEDLSEEQAGQVMGALMRGEAESSQVAGLLIALRAKGESPTEIAGFVRSMLEAAVPLELVGGGPDHLVDIVGTGGDGAGTFNISTVAAVVIAAAGVPVAKHGNRAASSRCGSADLLEAWGVDIELPPAAVAQCLADLGITFLYARSFHPAMRHVAPVRLQLGVRTVFNVLGPLSNPAGVPTRRSGSPTPDGTGHGGCPRAPRTAARPGVPRRGRAGRADHDRARARSGRSATVQVTSSGSTRPRSVWPRVLPERPAGRGRRDQRGHRRRGAGRRPGPAADIVALNAAAGLYARTPWRTSRRAGPRP
jgi:anthranilate phosphoribosyltransferase